MDDKLIEGIRVFAPHANAPSFVKATIVITMNDLFEFIKANPDLVTEYQDKKQIKLQLLESKEGKLYMKPDTYKKSEGAAPEPTYSTDLPF